jgi:uncharacterized OB-fold protein
MTETVDLDGGSGQDPPAPASRPRPVVDDHDPGGYWEAARRGELVVRQCDGCGAIVHMPMARCHVCGSWKGHWQPVSGRGHVYSWTVVDHQVHPAFPVPYTVVLVELDDHPGVRYVGHLPGAPPLEVDQPMQVRFEQLDADIVLPQWEPIATTSPSPAPGET